MLSSYIKKIISFDFDAYFVFQDNLNSEKDCPEPFINKPSVFFLSKRNFNEEKFKDLSWLLLEGLSNESLIQNAEALIAKRLGNNDCCVMVYSEGELAGYGWVAGNLSHVFNEFASLVRGQNDVSVLYNDFVSESFRGCGVQIYMDAVRKNYLYKRGFSRSLIFVGVKNFASLKNCMQTNIRYKLIYHFKVVFPKSRHLNFYPKFSIEKWIQCMRKK